MKKPAIALCTVFMLAQVLCCQAAENRLSFSLPDPEGNVHNLSDFKGQFVLLDFWASWCPSCRTEVPDLKRFKAANRHDNLAIIAISMDWDVSAWKAAMAEDQLGGIQLQSTVAYEQVLVEEVDLYPIPHLILLGPDGRLLDGDLPMPSDKAFTSTIDRYIESWAP